MNAVQESTYPIYYSNELLKRPIKVELFGEPIVLFRNSKGEVCALEDRCPHRGAPLSKGSVDKDTIRCPYHGWTFCGLGKCKDVPGVKEYRSKKIHSVKHYTVLEKYGLIWICSEKEKICVPEVIELVDGKYSTFSLHSEVEVGMQETIENVLDPMHTHFVHEGWIRSNTERSPQKVLVSIKERSVEALYLDEAKQSGIIFKMLSLGRIVEKSYGRFLAPNTIQLEYKTNKKDHLLITVFFVSS